MFIAASVKAGISKVLLEHILRELPTASDCSVSLPNFTCISMKELAISGSLYIERLHFFPKIVLSSQIIQSF